VTILAEQLQALNGLCETAQLMRESAQEIVYLEKLKIRVGSAHHVVDAILWPAQHAGYTTRLFLSQPFPVKAANWTIHQILGRPWHSWSWQGVPANLPLLQMLLCHLDALK
jgi:hypothetical protein